MSRDDFRRISALLHDPRTPPSVVLDLARQLYGEVCYLEAEWRRVRRLALTAGVDLRDTRIDAVDAEHRPEEAKPVRKRSTRKKPAPPPDEETLAARREIAGEVLGG